jgi:plastocyanin
MRSVYLIFSFVLCVTLFAACTSSRSQDTATPAPTQETFVNPTSVPEGDQGMHDSTMKEFSVDAQNYSFSPKMLEVNVGDKVVIHVTNKGGMHDFVIKDLGVDVDTPSGKTTDVTFTADKAGTFEFICSVGNHAAMGMKGTLTVK